MELFKTHVEQGLENLLDDPVNIWTVLIFVAVGILGWLVWPKYQVSRLIPKIEDSKGRAETEDNFRKTFGQVFGAAGIAASLYLGFMQLKEQSESNTEQLKQQSQTATDNLTAAYTQITSQETAANALLINTQVDKGFDQLGDPNNDDVMTHIGGVFVLKNILISSSDYRGAIVYALGAFVRNRTRNIKVKDFEQYSPPDFDVQAALTALGGPHLPGYSYINLSQAIIPWCNLQGLNYTQAYLSGAKLDHASLESAVFHGATMDNVSLINAKLKGANLNFAHLEGATLNGANLTNAKLTCTDFNGAHLRGVNLTGVALFRTDLSGADLRDLPATRDSKVRPTQVTQAQLDLACGDKTTLLPSRYHTLKTCPPD